MEKSRKLQFFQSQWRYLEKIQKYLLSSPLRVVQIGVFDWLSGRQKGSIFVKMFKNLLPSSTFLVNADA